MSATSPVQAWKGARVAVIGLARSGVSACLFLKRRGALVTGADLRSADQFGAVLDPLVRADIPLALGGYPNLFDQDALVLSPGVDPAQDVIAEARARGVPVLPELELGAREIKGRLVGITGTKGKSTTTMSLHTMLLEGGLDSRAVGNIGEPITAHVDGSDERSIFVAEASSFQLETTSTFRPDCAVFLNLFPDHLDRHPNFEVYAAAKARIFANQTRKDSAIVNAEDSKVLDLASRGRASLIPFRPRTSPHASENPVAYFENGQAISRNPERTPLFSGTDVQIPGVAVRANLLAAATAASHLGVAAPSIKTAVRNFRGVPHTFEKLGEVNGVAYFNDSKATTPESVLVALESFDTPVIAILGGRLKAGSFRTLREAAGRCVRSIYAIGESRGLVREALENVCPIHETDSLEEAVRLAHREAKPGDTVLLSPGCSSFDMFHDYAERGDRFKRAFRELSLQGAA